MCGQLRLVTIEPTIRLGFDVREKLNNRDYLDVYQRSMQRQANAAKLVC